MCHLFLFIHFLHAAMPHIMSTLYAAASDCDSFSCRVAPFTLVNSSFILMKTESQKKRKQSGALGERERLLQNLEALTKKQVPLCCLGLVSEGPCTLVAERFMLGKVKLSDDFDYLPEEPPLRRIEEAWVIDAEERHMPYYRDGSVPGYDFPLTAKEYVDIILSHRPTLKASFNHVITAVQNDPSRLPSRVSEEQLKQAVAKLKVFNAKEKMKRKRKRKLSIQNDGKGRVRTYYEGDKPEPRAKKMVVGENERKQKKKKKKKEAREKKNEVEEQEAGDGEEESVKPEKKKRKNKNRNKI